LLFLIEFITQFMQSQVKYGLIKRKNNNFSFHINSFLPTMAIKISIWYCLILLSSNTFVSAQCNFKSIGHRGGSSYYYPENTLVSLEHGFMEGIYAAEVDVRFTVDSILVLMHDY